jgi:hypothetical protein
MSTLALFPLNSVLFPAARMPLQIFEPRYLDLVSECLKADTGFGVVWLRQGHEVVRKELAYAPRLAATGVYARIVDWDKRPNGLLGITIEGQRRFNIVSSEQRPNKLHVAQVQWLPELEPIALPSGSGALQGLVGQLLEHPHVAPLGINPVVKDVDTLGCILAQLLPIDEAIKYSMLSAMDPLTRLEQLMELLEEMGG